jgi:hypothetical protein
LDLLRELGRRLAEELGGVTGQKLAELIAKNDFLALCKYPIDYSTVATREAVYIRQISALFSKLEFLDVGIDKEMAAVWSLMGAEMQCRETNAKFKAIHAGSVVVPPMIAGCLFLAQGHIARILGPRPTLDKLKFRFGPGATSLTRKRESSVKRKLGKGVSCSEDLVGWARALLGEMPVLAELHAVQTASDDQHFWAMVPVILHDGAMSFAFKNYSTYRTTETQPTLNGMGQLAVGDEMFNRCSVVPGLNLYDQTLNRELARIGSLTGELATLDLKSASNYIAVRLVQSLYPEDWFSMLKALRCGITKVPHVGRIKLEMFSGMGNGFTFPLQSLLFYALARASASMVGKRDPIVAVYGDDIIVDTEVAPFLMEVLSYCGLVVNTEKSFISGPFRESCGADYLEGIDIRPVYPKQLVSPASLFSLHNGLFRKGFKEAADWVKTLIHPSLLLFGPDDYGDGHLLCDDWQQSVKSDGKPMRRPKGRQRGWEGWSFDTFSRTAKRDWTYHPGDRILHTYAVYSRGVVSLLPGGNAGFADARVTVAKRAYSRDACRFVRAWLNGHGEVDEVTELPFSEAQEGWGPVEVSSEGLGVQGLAKAPTFPGTESYRKISIYTLK